MPQQRVFLSVIYWPPDLPRDGMARLMAQATGWDEPTSRLRVGPPPPLILGQVPRDTARQAVRMIEEQGGAAFAPAMSDIEALGPTLKVRDLRLGDGTLEVEPWRGAAMSIRRSDIDVLVRAKLSETRTKPGAVRADQPFRQLLARRGAISGLGWAMGGGYGLAAGLWAMRDYDAPSAPERIVRSSDKLDMHTRDGRVFQIDGDKFGFQVLGDMRGHSDHVNIDRMCDLLTHLCPDATVDPYFSLWRAPDGVRRMRLPQMHLNRDDPPFAFYSRWTALLYREMQRGWLDVRDQ